MTVLEYVRPTDVAAAVAATGTDPDAAYLAGGTTLVDLFLKDGVLAPRRLVDITRLPLRGNRWNDDLLRVGALTTMEELAADPTVTERLPLVRQALLAGASVQLRNMATIGGNLLQRTRCRYFRDPTVDACNKRRPGSGCAARTGAARMHAVLGTSEHCIALHASDLCVSLVAIDAAVRMVGPTGARRLPLQDLYLTPGDTPHVETVLRPGELITEVELPLLPAGARSGYLKVRDRTSYEFALCSAAVALILEGDVVTEARVALGGVATVPWRARGAEELLRGAPARTETFRAAARAAMAGADPVPGTTFKVELGRRTVLRALHDVAGVTG